MRHVAAKFRSVIDDLLLGVGSPSERLCAAMEIIAAIREHEVPEGEPRERFRELTQDMPVPSDECPGLLAATIYALPQEEVRRLILLVRDLDASMPRQQPSSAPSTIADVVPS